MLTMADQYRIWSIERQHFQWPWTTPILGFKITPFFDAEYLRNGTTYRHSFNRILIGTNTRPTQQCDFERPGMTLSDLAKYAMTRSAARSLCDSWASCSWTMYSLTQELHVGRQLIPCTGCGNRTLQLLACISHCNQKVAQQRVRVH